MQMLQTGSVTFEECPGTDQHLSDDTGTLDVTRTGPEGEDGWEHAAVTTEVDGTEQTVILSPDKVEELKEFL